MKRKVLKFDKNNKLKVVLEEKEEKKLGSNLAESFYLVSEVGLSISLPLIGGAFLGNFLDKKMSTEPKLTLFFIFLGLIIGLINTYLVIIKISGKK